MLTDTQPSRTSGRTDSCISLSSRSEMWPEECGQKPLALFPVRSIYQRGADVPFSFPCAGAHANACKVNSVSRWYGLQQPTSPRDSVPE